MTCRTYPLIHIRLCLAATLVVAAALFGYGVPAWAATTCYTNWSEAAVVVKKNKLVNVADLDAMVRDKLDGRIVKTTLCSVEKDYIYKIVVRKSGGQLKSVSVDAKKPFAAKH
ncbi:MAG: hypothetical protein ACRBCJ_05135 [Hyphomicrobiaceae bacterium]